jgi:HEAT repeat protein
MAIKLPKELIEELDKLFDDLTKPDPELRRIAMTRLTNYEQAGKLPLEAMIDLADAPHPAVSMYAIGALGRSRRPEAVQKLMALAELHRAGNFLFLETIIDALGDAGSKEATEKLLEFLGIKLGWRNKLLGKLSFKKEEVTPEEERQRAQLTLPIVRALEKIQDAKAAEALWVCVDSEDPLVRWHAIQAVMKCELTEFNSKLKSLAQHDTSEIVREMADIALTKLGPLPQPLNN